MFHVKHHRGSARPADPDERTPHLHGIPRVTSTWTLSSPGRGLPDRQPTPRRRCGFTGMVSTVPRLLAGANRWWLSGQGQETWEPGPCAWNPPRTSHLADAVGRGRSEVLAHLRFRGYGLGLLDGPDVPRMPDPEASTWPQPGDLRPRQWRPAGPAPGRPFRSRAWWTGWSVGSAS
jgi:hypothetical protein